MKRSRDEQQEPALPDTNLTKRADSDQPQGIARLIHFIWAGGDKIMGLDSIDIVKAWADKHKEFDIVLWVDARDVLHEDMDEGKLDGIVEEYREKFNRKGIDVFLNEVPSDYPRTEKTSAPVIIRDVTQHRMINEYVRYEIDKVTPNYGSSSDILRYRILDRSGSAYADSDVGPGEQTLLSCDLFKQQPTGHQLYLDHVSQKVNPPEICYEIFELFHPIRIEEGSHKTYQPIPGNDSFICTPNNPLMREILTCTENNYKLSELNDMEKFIMAAYGGADIPRQTIDRTGTTPVQTALASSRPRVISEGIYEMICSGQLVHVLPLRQTGMKLTQPVRNTRHWIQKVDYDKIDKTMLINRLVQQTRQEVKFFNALKLCDHTAFLRAFANHKQLDANDLIREYYTKLENIPDLLQNVRVAQLVSLEPSVHQFYNKHQLYDKTFILANSDSKSFKEICELATSKDKFAKLASDIERFKKQYIDGTLSEHGDRYQLYSALNTAIDFIELLQSNSEFYQRMFMEDRLVCLQNVKKIAEAYSEKFENAGFKFDFQHLEEVLANCQKDSVNEFKADADQFLKMLLSATPDVDESDPQKKTSGGGSKGF